ncbi:sarcosine oxidase subunit gamma [Paracoccus aminophilus]|uniref:Sarcosine oxidase, subunit gamma n=1 Tax=Paracoccus aminophilus JCM 7686 TaxID=1367847 RepID=S5XQS4_PARAH|nr:sarcosine oxidase subunit gamma family protein [Paracoccus aminophilus]AGT09744.1 sarcosine oxidase, subunit gamma [Paracoccus aminophilus JCM 7686]
MAEPLATITDVADLGMIQLRADLAASGEAIATAVGVALPAPTRIESNGNRAIGWMSPDELLVFVPKAEVGATVAALEAALQGRHALVLDVSDLRAVFDVRGAAAAQALSKLTPTDFAALPENGLRRSRLAQVACGIWPVSGGYRVMGFRSVADYMRGILTAAARPGSQLDPR